jgi:hypothetical protein
MNLTRFVHPAARWLPWLSVSKGLRPVSGLARVAINFRKPIDQYTAFPSYSDSGLGCVLAYRCRGSAGFEPASRFTRIEHLIRDELYTALGFLAFC